MEAYVLIRTMGGKAKNVLGAVKEMENVKNANGVYGSYDIVAKVEGDAIANLVIDKIRTLDGVIYTNTLIVAL